MKTSRKTLLALPAALFFTALTATPALKADDDLTLAACPAPVQETIRQNLSGGQVDEIDRVSVAGRTMYVAEIERPGDDNDRKVYVSGEGSLIKIRDEIRVNELPAAVTTAAQAFTANGGKLDDADRELENGRTTYHVEIDHKDDSQDLKVVFSESGEVLSQKKD
jgi:uncharacterized membrane protein YkoI